MSQVMYLCDQDSTKLSDKYYLNKLSVLGVFVVSCESDPKASLYFFYIRDTVGDRYLCRVNVAEGQHITYLQAAVELVSLGRIGGHYLDKHYRTNRDILDLIGGYIGKLTL